MSKLIIFCGASGTGKTTLSREVSKRLNMVCLRKDDIKECLYDVQGGSTLEDSKRFGRDSIRVLLYLLEQQVKNQVDVMSDVPFGWVKNAEMLQDWIDKYSTDVRLIICTVDEDTRIERTQTRERHHSHHDSVRERDPRTAGEYVQELQQFPGKHLVVNTNEELDQLVSKVLRWLEE